MTNSDASTSELLNYGTSAFNIATLAFGIGEAAKASQATKAFKSFGQALSEREGATVSTNGVGNSDGTMNALKRAKEIMNEGNTVDKIGESADDIGRSVAQGAAEAGWKSADLVDELASSGVKYSPDDVVAITKTADGKLVWLENGNSKAGMQHILDHADDFAKKGIQQDKIQDLVMESLTNGKVVDYQGRGTGRPIYEVTFEGKTYHTAITVGDNGYIVGANPTTWP